MPGAGSAGQSPVRRSKRGSDPSHPNATRARALVRGLVSELALNQVVQRFHVIIGQTVETVHSDFVKWSYSTTPLDLLHQLGSRFLVRDGTEFVFHVVGVAIVSLAILLCVCDYREVIVHFCHPLPFHISNIT